MRCPEDQIDKKNMEIKPEDGQVYTNMQDLQDELPDNTPRYILLSYPLTLVSRHVARLLIVSFLSLESSFAKI